MADEESGRRPWHDGPHPSEEGSGGWLALDDDELLFRIEALPTDHGADDLLLEVVRSSRHFFVRQEAAKKMREHHRLRDHSGDRHIGQILVRAMTRDEDVSYLERLVEETRHIEVRKAAQAQLHAILSSKKR